MHFRTQVPTCYRRVFGGTIIPRFTLLCLIFLSVRTVDLRAQCDAEVSGVLTYCNSFRGSGGSVSVFSGYFVGFRVTSHTGDTLNVVDINGVVPMNRGKRVDNINTQNEPTDTTRVPLRITGVGADTIEYWYFGPYPNGSSFNIALVDPMGQCDTVFVASGVFDCQDFTPYTDPGACDGDVPLYFLDFDHTVFNVGGGAGVNENIDEIFLVMTRSRESVCCNVQPANSSCFEFIVHLSPEQIGLVIDDVGSGSTGGKIYADTLPTFACLGNVNLTWPFQQDNGQSADISPLCLTGGVQDWIVLTCKPGGNVTNASIDAIAAPFAPPRVTIEPCDVMLEVIDADSAFWTSPDDPMLRNFASCSPKNLMCSFLYDTDFYGEVTACEGDTFVYIAGAYPLASECFSLDTIIYDTTYVVVYPIFDVSIESECNNTGDSVVLTPNVISMATGCNYGFVWSTGATTETITVYPDGSEYSVTVTRSDFPPGAEMCVIAADTTQAFAVFNVDCSAVMDLQLSCAEEIPDPDTSLVNVDGCGTILVFAIDQTNNGSGCPGDTLFVTRYYIIDFDADTILTTDDRDTCTQRFAIIDTTPPDITCPTDVTIECTESTSPDNTGLATASDNCTGAVDISFNDSPTPGACVGMQTIARTWTATDVCGNTATCVQMILIQDTGAPMIQCPADITISCEDSTDPSNTGMASATDACDPMPATMFADTPTGGSCPQEQVIERLWTATDACGNTTTCLQTITVVDNTAPTISCPPDITISCADSIDPTNTGNATATDNCDSNPTITFGDVSTPGGCPQERSILRLWIAMDACGNSDACGQTIIIIDDVPPVVTCPPDATVNCDADMSVSALGSATASDNCALAVTDITSDDSIVPGVCTDSYVIERTWTATDSCGNSSTCLQTVSVQDTVPPAINCPGDVTLSCTDSTSPDVIGMATATDNCASAPQVTFMDIITPGACVSGSGISRVWTATDNCGNTNTCVQSILIQDNTPPTITCPGDFTIDCNASSDPSITGTASATDACDMNPGVDYVDQILPGACAGDQIILRTWTATDVCGNTSTCVQEIAEQDRTAPVINCPSNVTIECDESSAPLNTGSATASDTCDPMVDVTFDDISTPGACANARTIARTWTATDDCGNTSTCVQIISIQDNTAPVVNCPPDTLVDCNTDMSTSALGMASATDNCALAVTDIDFSDNTIPGSCADAFSIERTWTATDSCGNSSTCIQIIQVQDTSAPEILCPVNITLACTDNRLPENTGFAVATDNCTSIPQVTYVDVVTPGACVAGAGIMRRWIAMDDCGNTSTCIQLIQIADDVPPVISCPQNVTILCGESSDPLLTGFATATDDCDTDPQITYMDVTIPGACGVALTILRTWTASDLCGNTSTCVQTIFSNDITPPEITCPPDATLNCGDNTDPANTGTATATDNCDLAPGIDYSDQSVPGPCTGTLTITRTWMATDDCGNTTTCLQIIAVQDNTPPAITCPQDATVECNGDTSVDALGSASASDNCTDVVTDITFDDQEIGGPCEGTYRILRTWTAVDDCGNINTCVQTILIIDSTPPTITCPPDGMAACGQALSPDMLGYASAVDDCTGEIPAERITFNDNINPGDCASNLILVRIWYAEDDCGNRSSCTQRIVITDNDPPVMMCPLSGMMECSEDPILPYGTLQEFLDAGGVVSDDCGIDSMSFMLVSETTEGTGCGTITRVYSISDACGTTAECSQTITVNDSEAPMMSFPPDMIPVCCPELAVKFSDIASFVDAGGSVSDDCALDSMSFVLLSEVTQEGDCNDHVRQVYQVSDYCGNTATAEVHYIIDRDPSEAVLVCKDNINVSLDVNCKATITPSLLLNSFEGCTEDFEVKAKPPYMLLPGNMVDGSYVGMTIPIMVIDPLSGNRCWTYVTFEDKFAPVLDCEADTIRCDANIDPLIIGLPIPGDVNVVLNPDGTYTATDLETCGPVVFEYFDETIYHYCGSPFERTIYRHWKATDASGNMSVCVDTLCLLRGTLDDIQLPPHYDGTELQPLECGSPCILPDGAPDVSCTGEPTGPICQNIIITYTDQRINTCGGSYKIHRRWKLVDVCTADIRYYVQRIKIADTTPPAISCVDTIYANTAGVQCVATVVLPVPVISDACSAFEYSVLVSAGEVYESNGQFIVSQVPPGDHTVRYSAIDECFNQSVCVSVLHVSDESAPVAICDLHSVVSLSPQKTITPALAFDFSDQSYDACSEITVYGRRMDSCIEDDWTTSGNDEVPDGNVSGYDRGTEFSEYIPFACCDIGAGPVMVELLVVDASGNTSRCMVEVTVQDKSAPDIVCPPDITVSCGTGIDSVAIYSLADRTFGTVLNGLIYSEIDRQPVIFQGVEWGLDGIAFDNCTLELRMSVVDLRDMCGAGEIRRTFTATDPANGSVSCTQVIYVEIADPLTEDDIIWPQDVEVDGTCAMDPVMSGQPVLQNVSCDLTAFQHDDIIVGPVQGACAKIIRTWYVIDWCQYNSTTGAGIWQRDQIIKVLNSAGPQFMNTCGPLSLCQDDSEVEETSPCVASVSLGQVVTDDCTAPAKLKSHYVLDLYADGIDDYTSPVSTGAGPNASIAGSELHLSVLLTNIPFNTPDDAEAHHVLRWVVQDDCNNTQECEIAFRLNDCKAPSPVCQQVIAPLQGNGSVQIWAIDFDASSSDNCTPAEDLQFSFSASEIVPYMEYDCADVEANGGLEFMVPVWVWDEWGNTSQCVAALILQDPTGICNIPNLTISGHIETQNGEPVELVHTAIYGSMSGAYMTASDGDYHFNHVPGQGQYGIQPYRNDDPDNGVSTLDLILMQKHLLGIQPFDSPYDFIAADVNNSKSVSALDLIELRKLILGIYAEFPNNTSWRFADASAVPDDPAFPYDLPEVITLEALSADALHQDFIGIKVGDLNGNVKANATQIVVRNAPRQWPLQIEDQQVLAGEHVDIPITGVAQMLGIQGALKTVGLRFEKITSGAVPITDEYLAIDGDNLLISWNRASTPEVAGEKAEVLFTCTFEVLADGRLSDMLFIDPYRLRPEVYVAPVSGAIETYTPGLIFTSGHADRGLPFALYQNVPNPWQHETTIRFDLPEAMDYEIVVYDVVGAMQQSIQGSGVAGANYVTLRDDAIPAEEVLYYHLVARDFSAVKKMILSR